ncbi:MAG: PEP-CTERM sorting domain-containing protein [Bryobacteraceae bacterium]|nr:PEP-CTERM sorting domain-containing protein [Bryobacteraceae bacterium]
MILFSFRQNSSVIRSILMILTALVCGVTSAPVFAAPIIDAADDFLPSFNGPHNGDLDVLRAEVFFNGTDFTFRSFHNGAIGTTEEALYVWGVDRGTHNQFFGDFRPGVLFDIIVVLRPDLTGTIIDFAPNPVANVNLAPGSVTVSGNMIQGVVSANFLASKGLLPVDYKVNLWPRTGLANNEQIADFAPDNDVAPVTTPEPSSMLLLSGGLLSLVLSRRRTA